MRSAHGPGLRKEALDEVETPIPELASPSPNPCWIAESGPMVDHEGPLPQTL